MSATAPVLDERGVLQEHCFQIGDSQGAAMRPAPPPSTPEAVPAGKQAKPPVDQPTRVAEQALTTSQLLAQLRARLRIVNREIKLRRKLEEERGQIMRLIAAAKTERDNVRRLRSA